MVFVEVSSFNFDFTEGETNQLKFEFFNPKYHDERSVEMIIDLGLFNQSGNTGWEKENDTITVEKFNKGAFSGKCRMEFMQTHVMRLTKY